MERKNTFVNGLIERMSLEEKIGALLTLSLIHI